MESFERISVFCKHHPRDTPREKKNKVSPALFFLADQNTQREGERVIFLGSLQVLVDGKVREEEASLVFKH
jgi:hypothetical protein